MCFNVSQYMYYSGGAEMCVFMFHTCIMVVELRCVFSLFKIFTTFCSYISIKAWIRYSHDMQSILTLSIPEWPPALQISAQRLGLKGLRLK